MNMNLDKTGAGESSQVLPQFKDTKLAKLRFGKQSQGGGFNVQNDWKIVLLYCVVNAVFLASSLLLVYVLNQALPGWIIFGIWVALSICGVICVILLFCRPRMKTSNKMESYVLGAAVSSTDNFRNFPCDPVMNRAITSLVFHGQDDCEECRLLRHREDYQRRVKEWSVVGSPDTRTTYQHVTVPAQRCHVNGGFNQSPNTTPDLSSGIKENGHAGQSQILVKAVVEKEQPVIRHIEYVDDERGYDVTSIEDDDSLYEENPNNNNNNNKSKRVIRRETPEVFVTPPDGEIHPSDNGRNNHGTSDVTTNSLLPYDLIIEDSDFELDTRRDNDLHNSDVMKSNGDVTKLGPRKYRQSKMKAGNSRIGSPLKRKELSISRRKRERIPRKTLKKMQSPELLSYAAEVKSRSRYDAVEISS